METPPSPQPPRDPQPVQSPAPQQPAPQAQPHYNPPMGPAIRFDAINSAFQIVFADLGTWVTASLIAIIPMIVISILLFYLTLMLLFAGGIFGLLLVSVVRGLIMGPIMFIMLANMCRLAIAALSGIRPSVNDALRFEPNVVAAGAIVGLLVGIGSALCVIPGLVAGGLLMLALPISVDRHVTASQAINMSMEAMKKDVGMASIFFLAVGFCSWIGAIGLGIGIVLTLGVFPLAVTMVYRDYFGFANAPAADPTPAATPPA